MKDDKNRNDRRSLIIVPAVALLLLMAGFPIAFGHGRTVETDPEESFKGDLMQADFAITIDAFEAEIVEGEDQVVDYTVENVGDETATQDIVFEVYDAYDLGGTLIDTQTEADVTLDGGQTYSDTFTWTSTDPGEYSFEVSSEDDAEDRNFDVVEEDAFFELTIDAFEEKLVEGEDQLVEYTIENTGDMTATQDIVFEVYDAFDLGGNVIYTDVEEDITLDVEETHSGTFSWTSDETGEYSFEVSSEDDAEYRNFDVLVREVKEKTAYLHNNTASVNENAGVLTMNTTIGEDQLLSEWTDDTEIVHDWFLDPPFAGNFTLTGETTINIWINIRAAEGHTNELHLFLNLYEVYPNGNEEFIGTGDQNYEDTRTTFNEYSVSADIDTYEISAESSLRAEFVIESSDNFEKRVAFGDSEYPSRLEISTPTYLVPESVEPRDSDYEERYEFPIDPEDYDTTIHFNSTVTNPFGGYDVHAVYLTIVGSEGTWIYREDMELVEGTETSYALNYTYEWDYAGVPEGEYTVIVSAVDNTGYNYRYPDNPGDETYGGHLTSLSETIWIGAERYYVNLQTIDSLDQTMEGANVQILHETEEEIIVDRESFTDEEGITNMSLRGGDNMIRIYWENVVVFNKTVEIHEDVPEDDPLTISTEVYTPTYLVIDSEGEPIENVNIHIGHPNGSTMRRITGEDGTVEVSQLPGTQYSEEYNVRSEWLTKVVDESTHELDSNEVIEIDADVYYLEVSVEDEREESVPDVHLTFRFDDTDRVANAAMTDIAGNATLRLPETFDFSYDIESRWRGVSVGSFEDEELTESRDLELSLEIYYIEVQAVDSAPGSQEGLGGAEVRAYNEMTGHLANTADLDSDGNGEIRLPSGEHEFEIYWRNVEVSPSESSIDIQEDTEQAVIECEVYEVEFTFVDERGEPIENARVTISDPEGTRTRDVIVEETADADGTIKERMPAEEWHLNVEWFDTVIYSDTFTTSADEETWDLELQTDVRYLTITTTDSDGEEISDAHVKLTRGDRIWSGYTEDGDITFRVPEDTYEVEAEYQSTYMLTSVDVNETTTMVISEEPEETLTFEDYPIPFYRTNLFMFLGLLIVIIATIMFAYDKTSLITLVEEEEQEEEDEFSSEEKSEENSIENDEFLEVE